MSSSIIGIAAFSCLCLLLITFKKRKWLEKNKKLDTFDGIECKIEHVQSDMDSAANCNKEKKSLETIRDIDVEKEIENLIGTNGNNSSISRVYDSANKVTTNALNMSHVESLKELVERVVEEAILNKIELHIENLEEETDVDYHRKTPFPEYGMDIASSIESWEENWLFRKRRKMYVGSTVSMLVPNPNEHYRALIGDQNIEDISSDDEEIEHELISINDEQKCNCTEEKRSCSLNFKDSVVIDKTEKEPPVISRINNEEENDLNFEFDVKSEIAEISDEDQVQQESEYTVQYDIATQKHLDSFESMEIINDKVVNDQKSSKVFEILSPSVENLRKCQSIGAIINASDEQNERGRIDEEVKLAAPPRPGTIAEREHKKWENARPIKNNPYSKKNIQKRLLEKQYNCYGLISENNISKSKETPLKILLGGKQVDFKRFSRDYYINDGITSNEEKHQRKLETNSMTQNSNNEDEIYYDSSNSLLSTDEDQSAIFSYQKENDSEVEKLLEKERRNNKNEMNAKFNNKESKKACDINYETMKTSQKRFVNKLDLKSFGHESVQIDSLKNQPTVVREENKLKKGLGNYEDNNFGSTTTGMMFSAKSVPNIASLDVEFSNEEKRNKMKNILVNSVENLSIEKLKEDNDCFDGDASMPILPSVRKLARHFSKSIETINLSKVSTSNKIEKKRPTTPEIYLEERPKCENSVKLELKVYENQSNLEKKKQCLIDDFSIISPGKLKNNIQFWEQLHKQN